MKISKLKILIVGPPTREDFYGYLKNMQATEIYFLWFVNKRDASGVALPNYIEGQYYWSDFKTPEEVLEKINPSRIIFFEIIDQRQIALIIAANYLKYQNFYLEHGAAGDKETAEKRSEEGKLKYVLLQRLPSLFSRIIYSIRDVWKVKYFYLSSIKFVSSRSMINFLKLPILTLWYKPNKALRQCIFPERVPSKCILFNQVNFEEFRTYTGIHEGNAMREGIPFFDSYFSNETKNSGPIIYIDQPFLEENICGWTKEHHKKIAINLFEFAKQFEEKIIIKLHPRSSLSLWLSYNLKSPFIEIVQFGDFFQNYLRSKLILGFSSSLMNGFLCARKNIVILGWHPLPHIFGADFSKTGLCHLSMEPDELKIKYLFWVNNNLAIQHQSEYEEFIKKFNYPFDGKATDRVFSIIANS